MSIAAVQQRPTSVNSLGSQLERDRLERRRGRMTVAVATLHRRRDEHRRKRGAAPEHLGQAIADFEAEIEAITARLRMLAPDRAPAPHRQSSGPR